MAAILHTPAINKGSDFSTLSPTLSIFKNLTSLLRVCIINHPNGYKVVAHCFHLHIFNSQWCQATFHVFIGDLDIFLDEISI